MVRHQTIIAATDFSESAQCAVKQASQLAKEWHSTLILVHVFNDSAWSSIKAIYDLSSWKIADPVEIARQKLEAICLQLKQDFGVEVEAQILIGRASKEIYDCARSRQAGLLVVGEHGENWVRDAVLGGTALKLLETTRIPVLLVRSPVIGSYQRILVATDFSATATRAARLALDLFPDAQHHLIHAYVVPFESSMRMGGAREEDISRYREQAYQAAVRDLDDFVIDCNYQAAEEFSQFALHGYPASVIFEQAQTTKTDLIVIGKHGGEPFEEQLLGSVTQNVLYHADCDVLLTP